MVEEKDCLEIFWTVGSLVGIMGTIIGTILNLEKILDLMKRVSQWFTWGWEMFKYWIYWKQHSPKCVITKHTSLKIDNLGIATISLDIHWQSRDEIYATEISDNVLVFVGKGIMAITADPNPNVWYLKPNEEKDSSYYLRTQLNPPHLRLINRMGSTTKCRVEIEEIRIGYYPSKSIKIKPFKIKIEYI